MKPTGSSRLSIAWAQPGIVGLGQRSQGSWAVSHVTAMFGYILSIFLGIRIVWLNTGFNAMFWKQPGSLKGFRPTAISSQCPEKQKSNHQSSKHENAVASLSDPKTQEPKNLKPPLIGTAKKIWLMMPLKRQMCPPSKDSSGAASATTMTHNPQTNENWYQFASRIVLPSDPGDLGWVRSKKVCKALGLQVNLTKSYKQNHLCNLVIQRCSSRVWASSLRSLP